MNLSDLREKRNRLMHEATAIMQAENVTAEQRTKANAILADVDSLDCDIAIVERTEAFEAEQRSKVSNRPAPGATSVEERSELEKRAFSDYIRFGKLPEQRDLLTTGTTGAAIIPQAYAPEIVQAQKAWGGLYNIVKIWKTANGAPMKTSLVNDTTNVLSVVTEGAAPSGTDPSATSILISTDELQGLVKVSLAELQDASFSVEQFLRDAFGPRYFRGVCSAMVNGTTNVGSIVSGYASNAVTTATTGTVAYADLTAAYGKLDPAYISNATWVMNSNTRASLMGVTDSLGRPLFIPAPNAGAFDTLLGRPVVIDQYHADVATGSTAIQFGDFEAGYKLRVVDPGLTIIRLNERFMDSLEVGFTAYARVGGAVTDAGTHPVVNVVIK
jgi:HK97 family phage major capsid protein